MRRRVIAALLAAVAMTAAGCGGSSDAADSGSQTAFVAGDGSIVVLDEAQRQPAPIVAGPTLEGGTYSTADHLGQVQVLNVWASWCAPCRAEAPNLVAVSAEYADRDVQFVGLNTRDSATAAQAFTTRFNIDYPNIVDTDGRLQLAFRETLPPQAIPSTVVLDQRGRVAARVLGSATPAALRGIIDSLLAEST